MATIDLNLVRTFAEVYESGSFSRAAARLGVPRSTVSRAIAALENELGSQLFQRTTRKVIATRSASLLFERVAPALSALQTAVRELPAEDEAPSGLLRITATADLGTVILSEAIARYAARYPNVQVEVRLTNAMLDLVTEQFDLALRVSRQPLRSSTLIARKLGSVTFRLYASPAYVARRGTPRTPQDLSEHDWVALRGAPLGLSGVSRSSEVRTRITCDDVFFIREALRHGGGVGALPSFAGDPDVVNGALLRVLPNFNAFQGNVFLVHPGAKHLPRKVTAFRELLSELLRQRPIDVRTA